MSRALDHPSALAMSACRMLAEPTTAERLQVRDDFHPSGGRRARLRQ